MMRHLLLAAAIVAAPGVAVANTPGHEAVTCPGPSVEDIKAQVGAHDAYDFQGLMRDAMMALWARANNGPLPAPPSHVVVLTKPGQPNPLLIYALGPCAVAVLEQPLDEIAAALRQFVGPVV